eukprot:600002-Hanusia_phi.AAC.3
MATWLPQDRVTVAVYVDGAKRTYVWMCGRVYLASEEAMLGHVLPPRTAVLGHFLEDDTPEGGKEPRVLVYDLALHKGEDMRGTSPSYRYGLLRGMLSGERGLFTLQWVGRASSAVEKMGWFKRTLPHPVECVVSIRSDPWVLTRLMHVHVRNPSSVHPAR